MPVILGAIREKTGRTLSWYPTTTGDFALKFEDEAGTRYRAQSACASILKAYRETFAVAGYRGGRLDEIVARIARDIREGKPPRDAKPRKKKRKPCPTCGKLR